MTRTKWAVLSSSTIRTLEDMAEFHLAQAVGWEAAAQTTAMDNEEPCKSGLLRSAMRHRQWAETLKSLSKGIDFKD